MKEGNLNVIEKVSSPERETITGTIYTRTEHAGPQEEQTVSGSIEDVINTLRKSEHPDCDCCLPAFRNDKIKIDLSDQGDGEVFVGTNDIETAAKVAKLISRDSSVKLWNPARIKALYEALGASNGDDQLVKDAKKRCEDVWMQEASSFAGNRSIE